MFDTMFEWMVTFRPGTRKAIPSDLERTTDKNNWDDAPDLIVGEVPRKRLTGAEVLKFENFKHLPRTMGISPEDRFRGSGEDMPESWLKNEPERMGSKWRETFNPEEHCGGGGIVAKLVRHAQKQQLLQAYSNRPDAEKTRFDYWALVRIVARRLLRPCSSKSQLRPHRPLYEAFKEAFFHNRTVKRKADQKAWFFAHVRQVLMRLKERYVDITYRPWNDPEIDMGASSEEEEENDAYVVIQPEGEHDVSKEVSKSDFWKSEAMGEFVKESFTSGVGTGRTSHKKKGE